MEQAIAASLEAVFILLGETDIMHRHDPISCDKHHGLLVAPADIILGLILDLCRLTVGMPAEFISMIINLLRTTWGPHFCSFKVKEAKELTRKLNNIAFGAS